MTGLTQLRLKAQHSGTEVYNAEAADEIKRTVGGSFKSLGDFITESNRGRTVNFVNSVEEAVERLTNK